MAKVQVTLPDYFSVRHYKSMGSFEHLDEVEKVIKILTSVTEHEEEQIMRWKMSDMLKVYKGVAEMFDEIGAEFYPVFEFKGIQYGFQPISKMTLAEWIDIDKRLEDPMANLEELLAILYRPIKTHKFDDLTWKTSSYIRRLIGKPENLFKLYDVEEYDTETREWRKDIFQDLPIEYALGCLSFFLRFSLLLRKDLLRFSPMLEEKDKEMMNLQIEMALQSLSSMDGSTSSGTWTLGKY